MTTDHPGLVIWDIDGTLIPADLRWLRRAVSRTYAIAEEGVTFPTRRVHGYTDESIVIDTAIASGIAPHAAEAGIERFHQVLPKVMEEGAQELAREQPAYLGAGDAIAALHDLGFVQTVLTGNLRAAAEVKLRVNALDTHLDLDVGAYGDDARDRFDLAPIVTHRVAERYGTIDAAKSVIIGDAPNDIACARSAGFRIIAVSHRMSRQELSSHAPDAILDRLEPAEVVSAAEAVIANGH
ncbi:haloacid dehalogenase [Nocardia cyriacigeorgica]|uniref:Haloacid dehalogenase n=1 Tax=Nocardia cyriacigeorgica TaxID=135487 RepID=A0A5R8PH03_9NOCA|nr:HAD family hydrolase [Nocardia cyriacigeorgica]TLG13918.1 haloacid dehalogenase [Nocardia cyriacigeorgica]